jgi:stress response protein YsnF
MAMRGRHDEATIPMVEEKAIVRKRKRITGAVRIRTEVSEREQVVEEAVAEETVEVERVPMDRWVDAPVPTRQEGDTTIIPVHEEVIVVEKRLRLVEEIHVTRKRSTQVATERVVLRREEPVVERLDAPDDDEG